MHIVRAFRVFRGHPALDSESSRGGQPSVLRGLRRVKALTPLYHWTLVSGGLSILHRILYCPSFLPLCLCALMPGRSALPFDVGRSSLYHALCLVPCTPVLYAFVPRSCT